MERRASTDSSFRVVTLGPIRNGEPSRASTRAASGRERIPVGSSDWYTLRAPTSAPDPPIDQTHLYAETGAVCVYLGWQDIRSREGDEHRVRWFGDTSGQARKLFAPRAAEATRKPGCTACE